MTEKRDEGAGRERSSEWRRRAQATGVLAAVAVLAALPAATGASGAAGSYALIAWNDLGMHCTDGHDFSVFAILPPYNNVHAQLVKKGSGLVRSGGGVTVTYEAVADAERSVNTTSAGKTNFWTHVQKLFGVALAPDAGLAGYRMPGPSNVPQRMAFEASHNWFAAEGVPITPFDDGGRKNTYPMMRIAARDLSGNLLASTDVVLPVSDEMDCSACHASGSGPAARPPTGWAWHDDAAKDVKLNILRLHDDTHLGEPLFTSALASAGYGAGGLGATVAAGTPILCARCHGSNALPGTGVAGVPPLTQSVHGAHALVADPVNGLPLDASANRSACYRCHPGSETKCLRGAMGSAVAADGTLAMQCQACHGGMSKVAAATRRGWLDEPGCQECHSGTATRNGGQIRFASVFGPDGRPRAAADPTFAVNAGTLYRFSKGHGGLQCEACHGAPHAEYPSSHANDNVQSLALQGHAGTISECTACHASVPETTSGGPHGMHPVGARWVDKHGDAAEKGTAGCKKCHGADLKGTVLSRALGDRVLDAEDYGTKTFWKGFQVSCWACHNGPDGESPARNRPATVTSVSASTSGGRPVSVPLAATDPERNALTLRIVSQAAHGTVGLVGKTATYFPEAGFTGVDTFTFAAWDSLVDSNLGTVTVNVTR